MSFQKTITTLAEEFATAILTELRKASIAEVADAARGPSTPTPRAPRQGRSVTTTAASAVEAILHELRGSRGGLGSRELQVALGMTKQQLARPIRQALAAGSIRKTGIKRGTRYFVR